MNIYCFSGLGADERVFQKLRIPEAQLHFVSWIPALKNESLQEYAIRLGSSVNFIAPYCLLGVSFGGMIASELAKVLKPSCTILISSALSSREVSPLLRLPGKTGLHKFIPFALYKRPNFLVYRLFGLKTSSEKRLFKIILKETETAFMKWAMSAIVRWSPVEHAEGIIRIHGEDDRIIPLKGQDITNRIPKATHFCILQQAEKVSKLIQHQLLLHNE
jgi:pimeloyl-ACP methyl ester carboxylesterase